MNAAAPFLDILPQQPDRPAIIEPNGRAVRYREFLAMTLGLTEHLRERGLAPGARVVLQMPNGIGFAASALAVLLAGGVPVLIEPGLGREVYLSRVKLSEPSLLIVHPLLLWIDRLPGAAAWLQKRELDVPPVPALPRLVLDDRRLRRLAKRPVDPARFKPTDRAPSDDGILIFTGGTTNLPKGVRLAHRALDAYIAHIRHALAHRVLENYLADTPQQVLYALRLGKTAYVTKGRKAKRAQLVYDMVRAGKIDAYFGSPYVWTEMMTRHDTADRLPPSLQTVMLGGAPVTPEFLERLTGWLAPSTQALVLYGMTEVGPVCAVSAADKLTYDGEGDLVGAPLGEVKVVIENADPQTGVGQVIVHSPSLYSGYLAQPLRPAAEGLTTGDLGQLVDYAGQRMLVLMGREKDMIIRHGVNIYPVSFESQIRALIDATGRPLVRECAMIGLWNETRQDEDVLLCVAPTDSAHIDRTVFREAVDRICGTDAKPDRVEFLAEIPVTGRQNKVDKQALRRRFGAPPPGAEKT